MTAHHRNGLLAAFAVAVACLHLGCAGPEEDVSSRRSPVGSFGPWTGLPDTSQGQDAPALAKLPSTTLTAFGLGTGGQSGGQIITTFQSGSGSWNSPWTVLTNNGGPFLDRPAAVGLAVRQGPLVGHFALVARRMDNRYYIRIQNQSGSSIVQDWAPIGTDAYTSAPAVAFVSRSSAVGPVATLVVAGLGPNNRYLLSTNQLRDDSTYSHSSWVGPNAPFGNQVGFDSAPALSYACPIGGRFGGNSLVVVGRSGQELYASTFNGTAWSAWAFLGTNFDSAPAVAASCLGISSEITVYGRDKDDKRIWVTSFGPGVPRPFTPLGTLTFGGSPSATGTIDRAYVAANRGTDGAGGSGPINTFVTSAASPASPDPTPMPPLQGLVFWVKGDVGLNPSSGLLTSWLDQAGQNQHIDQVPVPPSTGLDTIDGIPCVTFPTGDSTAHAWHNGGIKDRGGNELRYTHPRTVMAVIKPQLGGVPESVVGGPVFAMNDLPDPTPGYPPGNPNFECLFDVEPWGGHTNAWFVFDNLWPLSGYERLAPDTSAATWNGVPVLGEWRSAGFPAIAFAVNGGSNQPLTTRNGVATSDQAGAQATSPGLSFVIGNAWNNNGHVHPRNFHGAIAEILVWDYDLATVPSARAAAKAYLATRYPSLGIVP